MNEYRIKLEDRLTSVFGILAKNALPIIADIGISKDRPYGVLPIKTYPNQISTDLSDLGTPAFDVVSLEHPDLPKVDGLSQYKFSFPVMYSLSKTVNSSTSIINEHAEGGLQPGEIVESFGFTPWSINLKGMLVDMENKQFPQDLMRELNEAISIPDVYNINSRALNDMDILQVVLKPRSRIQFKPNSEYPDTIEFTLTFQSHEDIEILINNN